MNEERVPVFHRDSFCEGVPRMALYLTVKVRYGGM